MVKQPLKQTFLWNTLTAFLLSLVCGNAHAQNALTFKEVNDARPTDIRSAYSGKAIEELLSVLNENLQEQIMSIDGCNIQWKWPIESNATQRRVRVDSRKISFGGGEIYEGRLLYHPESNGKAFTVISAENKVLLTNSWHTLVIRAASPQRYWIVAGAFQVLASELSRTCAARPPTAWLRGIGSPWTDSLHEARAAYLRADYAKALTIIRPLAESGNARAQNFLGDMYFFGQGIAEDDAEAVKWYRLSAAQGLAVAQMRLGEMYCFEKGVAQDYAEALKWFRRAAAQGNRYAKYHIGSMYARGDGVAKDDISAFKWFRLAAAQGHAESQVSVGERYRDGEGVKQSYAEAIKWFRRAAAQGDASGKYLIGAMYENGQGVKQDYVRAYMWMSLSTLNGSGDSFAEHMNILAKLMTSRQIAKAQKLAGVCQRRKFRGCE